MIRKIHAYLVKEVNLAENTEEKSAEFVNRVCQVTIELEILSQCGKSTLKDFNESRKEKRRRRASPSGI